MRPDDLDSYIDKCLEMSLEMSPEFAELLRKAIDSKKEYMTDEEWTETFGPWITKLKERPQQEKFEGGDEWKDEDNGCD
tara:strand:- start:311 stop:547 length:237 start_codon:yes stop_codon:yes gene_type:complete